MSHQVQHALATRLTVALALAIAASLLLVGWTLYKPSNIAADTTAQTTH